VFCVLDRPVLAAVLLEALEQGVGLYEVLALGDNVSPVLTGGGCDRITSIPRAVMPIPAPNRVGIGGRRGRVGKLYRTDGLGGLLFPASTRM
jgi:hypothetical protein